jgi:general L-amino acid transport system substrate-binding protein
MMKAIASLACGVMAASLMATGASAQATPNSVKQKGFLNCGASSGFIDFGMPDAQGNWTGFDVDFCRALAAAIFDDPQKVRFVPLNAKDRFTALQAGEVERQVSLCPAGHHDRAEPHRLLPCQQHEVPGRSLRHS